jgi:hypothetical protein
MHANPLRIQQPGWMPQFGTQAVHITLRNQESAVQYFAEEIMPDAALDRAELAPSGLTCFLTFGRVTT